MERKKEYNKPIIKLKIWKRPFLLSRHLYSYLIKMQKDNDNQLWDKNRKVIIDDICHMTRILQRAGRALMMSNGTNLYISIHMQHIRPNTFN